VPYANMSGCRGVPSLDFPKHKGVRLHFAIMPTCLPTAGLMMRVLPCSDVLLLLVTPDLQAAHGDRSIRASLGF
jgi:hypothetical protein